MLSRKDLLRTAFDEAVRVVSISWTEEKVARAAIETVSYTHLTLPTIA